MPTIPCTSFSALNIFETCPYWAYLRYVKRHPEPPKEKTDAGVRGNIIHDEAEQFVRGNTDFPNSLKKFKEQFLALRASFLEGCITLEENWGFTKKWIPCSWEDKALWLRMKLDAAKTGEEVFTIIDYKSGKSWGNEVKHSQQGILYGLGALMKFPTLEWLKIQFWYLDEGKMNPAADRVLSRDKIMRYFAKYNERLKTMTSATHFPHKANTFNCMWCPYRSDRGGQCEFGVTPQTGRK